jgi:hypothetical protein
MIMTGSHLEGNHEQSDNLKVYQEGDWQFSRFWCSLFCVWKVCSANNTTT